ncbi:DNA mismatch repair protein Mlh1 [Sitophilus oryzae]|uniref:DNA mismatch repair protein Mlh1 n=1 Tax=Sitophilus oryzae TaxID=7048 RepID=A0A6J2XCP6_SITOR|nr:DNA mismatch repair protein Mlh1 [Sitophilus oryzae]XP_030749017.1 DNA mismatch repair protein Mlh1 [Sitophilus oryzae]
MATEIKPIKRLQQDVVNRIAAGEVIQRPMNALKELIENSLDAKSTNIQITVKNGGLKFFQIQDNGTGIRKEDFEIVCERFTTSKLTEFEDLQKIATFGFRGEALASISHVAHLSIISKTKHDICAYQAEFNDGKLKMPPRPMAGNQGTIITVEDLFYNMTVRRQALRSPAEEYQKISEIVSKYAIHNASIGFALKKYGENNDIRTSQNSNCTENIRLIYGNCIARELVEFDFENRDLDFKVKGYMTNVNYSHKKYQFILFINNRLVDCQGLKKCIDAIYQTYLPKNNHPFVYLSLELNPRNIDVNVHPTKHEVHFLNESEIVESITTAIEQKLLGSNNARIFYTQSKLPNVHFETAKPKTNQTLNTSEVEPKYLVRTDSSLQKLDKFFEVKSKKDKCTTKNTLNVSLTEEQYQECHKEFVKDHEHFNNKLFKITDSHTTPLVPGNVEDVPKKSIIVENDLKLDHKMGNSPKSKRKNKDLSKSEETVTSGGPSIHLIKRTTRVETKLASVLTLRKDVENNCHRTLRETFAQHVFVGAINPKQALIQYNIQLLMCNTMEILQEFFYQLILYNFQNFDCYRFAKPLSIKELALIGLDLPDTGWTEDDGPKEELATRVSEILIGKGAMLNEYFSLDIDKDGNLRTIPILLENYIPDLSGLPLFLIRLATEVDWETEKECFHTFSQETAIFYANVPEEDNAFKKSWRWVTEYVLYPAIKTYFLPPKDFSDTAAILEIANLPNLYKVFERC